MREHSARGFWLLLCLLASAAVLVSACETTDDPASSPTAAANRATSPAVDSDMALSTPQRDVLPGAVPTRTLGPIVSFTPKFTATPIPSNTPTPTITLTPTETTEPPTVTPTLTPSPSPTASGAIRSTSAQVNVREEPNGDVVQSIPNGSELGVLDVQEGENGFDWYQVSYLPEDGEELRGWVRADLVETDFVPPAAQAAAPAGTPGTTPPTRTPGPTPNPDGVQILANCRQATDRPQHRIPPTPTTEQDVYIWWSWFVTDPEYMDEHLQHAQYDVQLDGEPLDDWDQYASEIVWEEDKNLWFVYWYVPVGKLDAGEHTVTYRLTWAERIYDGRNYFGPDTTITRNEGNCTFTVTEP